MRILFSIFLFITITGYAQRPDNGMIAAEKRFAAYSVDSGTRAAFLKFMDSSAIMFEKGEPVAALPLWTERKERGGMLNWKPTIGAIATSGDYGFTSGPWTFQASQTDTVSARGHFFTIWHRNAKGEWKFLFDLGVNTLVAEEEPNFRMGFAKTYMKGDLASMIQADSIFSGLAYTPNAEAARKLVSHDFVSKRPGTLPSKGNTADLPSGIKYQRLGQGISPDGYLAYVYGKASNGEKTDSYARVWIRQGGAWRLVFQLLRL